MKIFNVGDLQNQPSFCDTSHSRVGLSLKDKRGFDSYPLFDGAGFERDLYNILSDVRHQPLADWLTRAERFYNTYFFPASFFQVQAMSMGSEIGHLIDSGSMLLVFRTANESQNLVQRIGPDDVEKIVSPTSYEKTFLAEESKEFQAVKRELSILLQNRDLPKTLILAPLLVGTSRSATLAIGSDDYFLYTGETRLFLGPQHVIYLQRFIQQIELGWAHFNPG